MPQTDLGEVLLYKFINNKLIKQEHSIKSSKVKSIFVFKINQRCFIAIDGFNFGIYELTEDGFSRKNLVHGNLHGIHYWLPIPVQTYRDEVILLAERRLEHGTHAAYTHEIIVNNGGRYDVNGHFNYL